MVRLHHNNDTKQPRYIQKCLKSKWTAPYRVNYLLSVNKGLILDRFSLALFFVVEINSFQRDPKKSISFWKHKEKPQLKQRDPLCDTNSNRYSLPIISIMVFIYRYQFFFPLSFIVWAWNRQGRPGRQKHNGLGRVGRGRTDSQEFPISVWKANLAFFFFLLLSDSSLPVRAQRKKVNSFTVLLDVCLLSVFRSS